MGFRSPFASISIQHDDNGQVPLYFGSFHCFHIAEVQAMFLRLTVFHLSSSSFSSCTLCQFSSNLFYPTGNKTLYFLTEKYLSQICLISTLSSQPNCFLQFHCKIAFSEPSPAVFPLIKKGSFILRCFVSQDTSEEHDYMSFLSFYGDDFILLLS